METYAVIVGGEIVGWVQALNPDAARNIAVEWWPGHHLTVLLAEEFATETTPVFSCPDVVCPTNTY
jgi:hypothetical protein